MFLRIDNSSECASIAYHQTAERSTRPDRDKAPIDMLPEEILLQIFAFYMCEGYNDDEWETLVHVCRRWRSIVFTAPHRLNLKLVCTRGTPVSKMLDIWPPLPIAIRVRGKFGSKNGNIFAAFDKHDQVCKIHIDNVFYGELKELTGAMEAMFPALTDLYIRSPRSIYAREETATFSESFLGGSAPNLRSLRLVNIAFPALPKLLLSSFGLVSLSLSDIPHSGYIPSDEMTDCLSSLTRLEYLQIDFHFYRLRSGQASRRQPPLTRTVFPVLSKILLKGITECLDHILAHIEAPLLRYVHIDFLDPPIFDIPRIAQYIGRMETFEAFDQVYMYFHNFHFNVVLSSRKGTTDGKLLTLSPLWHLNDPCWKLLELALDFCDYFEPFDFCGVEGSFLPSWENKTGNGPWLHLVRFFTTVKYIYLNREVAAHVAPALQELTGAGRREVLPVLRNIFIERLNSSRPIKEAIGHFVAARTLLSDYSIDVQCWVKSKSTNRSGRR